jgi:hypothetical protein
MYRTDDPVADWDAHCAEQERQAAKLPHCSECEHPITTEMCFSINGELICENCMDGHRVFTDDFME